MPSVTCESLGVRFQFDREQRPVTPVLARLRRGVTESWGLRGISVTIGPGEAVALIGPSGAGKSTLLRAIAGVLPPDDGTVVTSGRIGALLATDAGLTGVLTGRENATLIAALAGLPRRRMEALLSSVASASGLGPSFDRPVMSYSEGMRARVGFAVVIEAAPDVLLLDEVHEALDHEYREVVERAASAIVARGGIVIAAGHDHPLLERIAERGILLECGTLVADGPFTDVQARYLAT
ncbi:MAG: ATP-binding cassette domain-containing protein [Thermoleophilia bacterium]|nr:ATP-binding cassette domain-containing protein [Thermoleophilia bacterium]MDH5334560.1 ATP-binding cassette domain-containing protein [Thermoleophilia bacterium]